MKRIKDVIKEETKKRIIVASIQALAHSGEQGLKIASVAREAGIANGTFYLYFKNRNALIEEVLHQISSQLASCVISVHTYFKQSGSLDRAEIEALVQFAEENPEEFGVVIDTKLRLNFDEIHPLQLLLELRRRVIKQGVKNGNISQHLNPRLAAEADTAMLCACIQAWLKPGSTIHKEELVESLLQMRRSWTAQGQGADDIDSLLSQWDSRF